MNKSIDNIEQNLDKWDRSYAWPQDGDEWQGQARACGVSYDVWKKSLIEHLILPYVDVNNAIEIAPGHGRWTEYLLAAKSLTLVDLSQTCLAFCRKKFISKTNIAYWITSGAVLPLHQTDLVDLVWSYDAFVHMHPDIVQSYIHEIARVLRSGGTAILHHANVADPEHHDQSQAPGWRSAVSAKTMRAMIEGAGLQTVQQLVYWDNLRGIGVPNGPDCVTQMRKP
jgi:ubiquinone/menaquinone biosynthesis C-methylase UbiE